MSRHESGLEFPVIIRAGPAITRDLAALVVAGMPLGKEISDWRAWISHSPDLPHIKHTCIHPYVPVRDIDYQGLYPMPDDKIRHHLRRALAAALKSEKRGQLKNRLEDNINLVEAIEKMKPLLKLLDALNAEISDVEGLAILPYPNGDGVAITTEIHRNWLYGYIRHYGNSGFKYYEEGLNPEDGFYFYSDSVDEVMAKVIDRVSRHICGLQARSGL